jgi:CheY-like chemotaxis protein
MRSGVILLVEDSEDSREVLATVLQSEGFVVREAVDALDALWQLDGGLIPDLILTDWMMPLMDGRSFCGKLRKDPRYRNIPVIVISAVDVTEDDLSLSAKLKKPVDLKTLLDAIRNF